MLPCPSAPPSAYSLLIGLLIGVPIAAPHTRNRHRRCALMMAPVLRLTIPWSKPATASAEVIQAADGPLQRVLPPEGTRGRTQHWKTGLCFIALPARVPIVMTAHART